MHKLILLNNLSSKNKKPIRACRGDRGKRGNFGGYGDGGMGVRRGDRKTGPEGGFPTYLRFKKKGFKQPDRKVFSIVKTSDIERLSKDLSLSSVTKEDIKNNLSIKSGLVKVLFDKPTSKKIKVQADSISKKASEYVDIY